MGTPRLHYDDPLLLEASASVIRHGEHDGRPTVILEATPFYPESGGQLGDRGTIEGAEVADVQLDDAGTVHHVMSGELPAIGAMARCLVDEPRRRQHMAMHTAQHCLSRALLDLHGAVTLSSRLGASVCTLDVDRPDLDTALLRDAASLVNEIADRDRPVRQYFPSAAELAALSLRKPPPAALPTRIVDIEGFDITPCGGTHVTHTSQLGLLLIRGTERYKGGTRISFEAGPRAREALLADQAALRAAASAMNCAPAEVAEATARLRVRLEEGLVERGHLRARLADLWAERIAGAESEDAPLIARVSGADAALLKLVAERLATGERFVALAAEVDDGLLTLIARGPDHEADAGEIMKRIVERGGGRGGGRPAHAQGRLPSDADFEQLVRDELR